MIRALLFYGSRSARNRLVKRTKDVRYLAGIALAAAYFFWVFGRTRRTPASAAGEHSVVVVLFTVFLVLSSVFAWWLQTGDNPLALTKAQAQSLIPAPLTSRDLMLFKILTMQPQFVGNALFIAFLLRIGVSSHFTVRAVTAYLILFAIYLQRVGVTLARARGGTEPSPIRFAILAVVRVWLLAALLVIISQVASVAAGHGILQLQRSGIPFSAANTLPWSIVLWPFHALIAPAYAETTAQIVSSFGAALLVVAVETTLVFQASPDWERVGISRSREERQTAKRAKKQELSASGSLWERTISLLLRSPAASLTRKNLISAGRTQPLRPQVVMVLGTPILLAATLIPQLHHLTSFASGVASAWGAMLLFAGPNFVRNDLRLDLPRLRLLRTYPLTSAEICFAEVAASASLITLLQLVLLVLSTLALLGNPVLPLSAGRKLAFAFALACLLPGMNAINVSAQNVFAVVFPKWVSLGMIRPSRTANPGQYYISLLISAGLFLLSMIVPAIAALGIAYALRPFGNSVAIVGGALVAGVIALGEAALVLRWMATLLDRVDPASVAAN